MGAKEKYFGLLDCVTASRNKKKIGTNYSPFRANVSVQLKECLVTEGKFDRKHFPRIPQYIFLRVVQCLSLIHI